jgi:hypothetical protein
MANANELDFFGGGSADGSLDPWGGGMVAPDAPAGFVPGQAANRAALDANSTRTANTNRLVDPNASQASGATQAGNIGGASGAYNTTSDSGRAQYDYMHDLGDSDILQSPGSFLNRIGEQAGISHVGDVANPLNSFDLINPTDPLGVVKNIGDRAIDPDMGMGQTIVPGAGGAMGGKPISNLSPGTRAAADAYQGMDTSIGAIARGDTSIGGMPGGGGQSPFDTTGGDRGGMGVGGLGGYQGYLENASQNAAGSRQQGADVMSGATLPGGAGAGGQTTALNAASKFAKGPKAATGALTGIDQFLGAPEGPSAAQLTLQEGAQGSMADALSMARSGRARDAGSQARMMNVALAENAATGVDTARNAGLLRAKEAADAKAQQLQGLGLKASTAQGIDQSTLGALGLQGDLASALRSGNVQERGQTLNYAQGQDQLGVQQQGDVLDTIPKLEQIRHQDQFSLTPQQQLEAARMGQGKDKTTADYVTALLGDVLGTL